jgi:hypothetical protein
MAALPIPEPELFKTRTFSLDQLKGRYQRITASCIAECTLATECVGGVNADENGVRAFVTHHLGLVGSEAESAVARIVSEELGERDAPSETGELKEKLSYGINMIRRDQHGPWLGSWMVKACLKAAASRLGLYAQKKGTKGDMAEMGQAQGYGISLLDPEAPYKIYLIDKNSDTPATTRFSEFKGRVSSPQGSKSIVNHNECVPEGSRFSFEYRFYDGKLTEDDVADIFASAMVIGLGSAKAFDRGKFSINKLTYSGAIGARKGRASIPVTVP